eukprot:CAMPEP_0170450550 /NCGR_PEP_ID=MMETSP0123-20130129/47_1 /TAXON_ID=182087 /ORGANISM="Favella ehrenbergii, Strain Fehren 1" /LENGTH=116 /DNA_ID=CAMNT_0010711865 /DNA_START=323 /DNA_END=673 /DNA_ORIENTATION=+
MDAEALAKSRAAGGWISAIDVLLCVDEVEEAVFVLVARIDVLQLRVRAQHVLFVSEENEAFLTREVKSGAEDGQNFADGEGPRHHELWVRNGLQVRVARAATLLCCRRFCPLDNQA